jgi:hypothetical protein
VSFCDPNGPAVIVDPYSSGALFAPAFAQVGVPVVAVTSSERPPEVYASSYRPQHFREIITCHGDPEPVADRLRALRPRCVLPGCESGVELADLLAPQVTPEVANIAALAPARRHKGAMAEAVAHAGLPIIRQICTDDPAEVTAWIERSNLVGHDLVVKPPKSASTDSVTKAPGGRGWREAFDDQIGNTNRLGLRNDRVLVQEYAEGTEYVVDTFSYHGIHTVADVCRYRKVDNGPYMAVYDSLEWLPPTDPAVDAVVEYAKSVLDAVGLRVGAAHVELMLTPNGPRLIEIGARPHGGGHPRFCRAATGDSQVDRTVRYFTRHGAIPGDYGLRQHVLVVFLISRTEGVVRNAESLDRVRELASYHGAVIPLRNGDRVSVTKDLFGSLDLGFVVLASPDPEQVLVDYGAVREIEAGLVVDGFATTASG